jgi:ribosomal protein S3AE
MQLSFTEKYNQIEKEKLFFKEKHDKTIRELYELQDRFKQDRMQGAKKYYHRIHSLQGNSWLTKTARMKLTTKRTMRLTRMPATEFRKLKNPKSRRLVKNCDTN